MTMNHAAEQILRDEQAVRQHKPGAYDALLKDVLSVDPKDAAKVFAQVKAADAQAHLKTELAIKDGHLIIDPVVSQAEYMDRLQKMDWTANVDAQRVAKEIEAKDPKAMQDFDLSLQRVHGATHDDRYLQIFINQVNQILKNDGSKAHIEMHEEKTPPRRPPTTTA